MNFGVLFPQGACSEEDAGFQRCVCADAASPRAFFLTLQLIHGEDMVTSQQDSVTVGPLRGYFVVVVCGVCFLKSKLPCVLQGVPLA